MTSSSPSKSPSVSPSASPSEAPWQRQEKEIIKYNNINKTITYLIKNKTAKFTKL